MKETVTIHYMRLFHKKDEARSIQVWSVFRIVRNWIKRFVHAGLVDAVDGIGIHFGDVGW